MTEWSLLQGIRISPPGRRSTRATFTVPARALARASALSSGLAFTLVVAAVLALANAAWSQRAEAQDYRYNPANKVDPFLPITLRKPTIKGMSRLQDYDVAALELVGPVMGAEMTALILTPAPREGILAKIGDRVGKKGGRVIAISRAKLVVREPSQDSPVTGRAQKFVDITMTLSSTKAKEKAQRPDKVERSGGFPGFGGSRGGASDSLQEDTLESLPFAPALPPGAAPGASTRR